MKTIAKMTFAVCAVLASISIALPAFAQSTSGYEWRTDDTGTYLYVTGNNPVRVYAKDVRDIRIVEEAPVIPAVVPPSTEQAPAITKTFNVDTAEEPATSQDSADPISPFGPREKFLQYYMQLNDVEKRLYETLYFAILNREETCHFDEEVEDKTRIVWAVYNDHPELFWLKRSFNSSTTHEDHESYDFTLKYLDFGESFEQSKQKVDAVVEILVQEASKLTTDAEKERFVHDYLVMNTNYGKDCDGKYSEYGALVLRCAVCEGFSHAFQHIMLKLGIPTTYMPGTTTDENGETGEHAWNQVILDGQCHNVDVTSDEFPPDEDFGNSQKLPRYTYFNLSDEELEDQGYHRDSDIKADEVALPVCKQSAHVENVLGLDALIQAYSYFNLNVDSAIRNIDDYYSLMYNEIVQSKKNKVRVFALIKGEKLHSKINNLSMKEKKKGYLSAAWKKAFNDYSSAKTSLTMYQVSPNVWLSLTEVTFSK